MPGKLINAMLGVSLSNTGTLHLVELIKYANRTRRSQTSFVDTFRSLQWVRFLGALLNRC